jgi:Phage Tail Collar Domain
MKQLFFILAIVFFKQSDGQNIGIGVANPVEKLEVNGKVKTDGIILTTLGVPWDFLHKVNNEGAVGFKKAHGGMGLTYIICVAGIFPSRTGPPLTAGPFVGQIIAFAGNFAPTNWRHCHGQELKIDSNTALFSLMGHTFGGTDSTFRLPDLRGRALVGPGTSPAGYAWIRGQNTH